MPDAKDLKGKTGLKRLANAFLYSAIIAILLPVSLMQTVALIAVLLFLLIVEILNSAIEAAIDRIGAEIHPLSKRAKDMGSCAVLMACAMAALVWISILADCIFNR